MSAPPSEFQAFHLGIVVRDLDAVAERYGSLLGIEKWYVRENESPKTPWLAGTTDARIKVAYGRGGGQTFELLPVLEGRTQHLEFLEEHGEGVQHIGFWVPDVRAAVESAVAQGARITTARLDPQNNAVVQLSPSSSTEAMLQAIDPNRLAFVDPGVTMIQFEFIGPGSTLRDWLKEDFQTIATPPDWLELK